jgi:hypothetical protein
MDSSGKVYVSRSAHREAMQLLSDYRAPGVGGEGTEEGSKKSANRWFAIRAVIQED